MKLSKDNINAWNVLGDLLWNKGDLDQAVLCFKEAIHQKPDKYSYQELSIIQRQFKNEPISDLCRKSLYYINKAIELDENDGYSYCINIL